MRGAGEGVGWATGGGSKTDKQPCHRARAPLCAPLPPQPAGRETPPTCAVDGGAGGQPVGVVGAAVGCAVASAGGIAWTRVPGEPRRGALFPGRPTHQLLCPPAVQSSRLSRHVPETGGGGGAWAGRAGSRESVPARPVSRRETDVTGPRAAARHAPAMRRAYHGRRLRPSRLSAPRLPEARSTQCAQHDSRLSPEHRRDRSCGLPHTGCNSPEALPRAETDRTGGVRGSRV